MEAGQELLFLMEKVWSMTETGRGSVHPLGLATTYLKFLFVINASWSSCAEGSGNHLLILPSQYMVDTSQCLAVACMTCVRMQVT